LVVLDGFKDIRRIQRKEKAHRMGAIRRNGA
jgi:hypothetical protein